ncbi:MAG TPA: 16S rRNA (adenine(1518)-N(6)/adenine(1519)-N(6))-dimethyltransferase RsmA [Candidatus Polarisedimenticolaceae bacterium]|nr:16S rRNA (adenine(1518)-N(6)/adenine(1519)-N(6))-dimethyltransferase RsmA [Candidatus Polarisedimenticolaceae bacterium]
MRRQQSSTRRQAPRARRRFGQHFLADRSAIARIVASLGPIEGVAVVEIGPGRGALTEALLAEGARVVAIEIDRDLARALADAHADPPLRVIAADVLEVPLASLGRDLLVVGNLPYNVSKPVAMKLCEEQGAVARAVLMFQREVADRLTAACDTGAYGPLTVLAGLIFRIERLFDLRPGAFRPPPEVTSTVTRWTRRDDALAAALVPALKTTLKIAFARRRQTLQKNLRAGLHVDERRAASWLEEAGLDGSVRAEAVPPDGFLRLAAVLPS